jgi:hypothetical protein
MGLPGCKRSAILVANVARNGETFLFVTRSPLTRPVTSPIVIAIPAIAKASLFCPPELVAMTAAVAITDATDKSNPRTRITSV